ncbi:MAG: exo-beta-N-acetylmuramidase NamZ domain-containing protein [Bacteroidia bacterium]
MLLLCHFSEAQLIAKSDFNSITAADVKVGAERMEQYIDMLKGKNVAVVANQSSMVKNTLLVDTLLSLGIHITRIFAPEHGFYGTADAGATIKNSKDKNAIASITIISLYGKHTKPTPEDLKNIDVVVYDLQDVGVRFFTYISTLHLVMEACAENNKQFIVLDRPNPNGFYVDGPVLDTNFRSFIGLDPVPIVYGMTAAEYARMLNGEKWLKDGKHCDLICVAVQGYNHKDLYELPVKPSPNLPNMAAVYLYPSLALFEGTVISVGRGTDKPFQVIGCPELQNAAYTFTPESRPGATDPMYKGQVCHGYDLHDFGNVLMKNYQKLYFFWLKGTLKDYPDKANYFKGYFTYLAGTDKLQKQIEQGLTDEDIRKSWEPELTKFKAIRKRYLLYDDF